MIAFVDTPPRIEPHGDGFRVTLTSGGEETTFMLTLHALSGLCGMGGLCVKEAQAKAAIFEPTPFQIREEAKRRRRKTV